MLPASPESVGTQQSCTAVSVNELHIVHCQWLPSSCSQELVFTLKMCCCSQYPDKALGGHYEIDMVGPEMGVGANPNFTVRADSTHLLIHHILQWTKEVMMNALKFYLLEVPRKYKI